MADLDLALTEWQVKKAQLLAHSLKGASANVAAPKLQSSFIKLEESIKDGDRDNALRLYEICSDQLVLWQQVARI